MNDNNYEKENECLKREVSELKQKIKELTEENKELREENEKSWYKKMIKSITEKSKETISTSIQHTNISNNTEDNPSGLRNTTGICYMNAMMQALASSRMLINNLLNLVVPEKSEDNLRKFISILLDINMTNNRDTATNRLEEFMNIVNWNRTTQQDAFQLLSFFVNAIHEEIGLDTIKMPPKMKILHTFSENANYNKVQDHLAISLPLCGQFMKKPGEEIATLLDGFFKPSFIDDTKCHTSMFLFEEVPTVMLLHIQANEWIHGDNRYTKPIYYVKYGKEFEYEFVIQKDKNGLSPKKVKTKYRLVAVVEHIGSVTAGHYITYRQHEQYWYKANDRNVSKITFEFDIVPYIMVYEKID